MLFVSIACGKGRFSLQHNYEIEKGRYYLMVPSSNLKIEFQDVRRRIKKAEFIAAYRNALKKSFPIYRSPLFGKCVEVLLNA